MTSLPKLMGILNVTPDSFSDGGQFFAAEAAIEHGQRLVEEGADILDVGGESTRPGAEEVSVDEEMARVCVVIEALKKVVPVPISVDTRKPEVAHAAVTAGAKIWNDVSALTFSEKSVDVARNLAGNFDCDLVLMHSKGSPETMQNDPTYDDVVAEVSAFLVRRLDVCLAAGIARARVMIDPGIGFGKTLDHNLTLMMSLGRLGEIAPVLLGASRKSFIGKIDDANGTRRSDDRIGGSIAAALAGMRQGVNVLRVHDVAATRQALNVAQKLGF